MNAFLLELAATDSPRAAAEAFLVPAETHKRAD